MRIRGLVVLATVVTATIAGCDRGSADVARVGGSGAVTAMLKSVGAAFATRETGANLEVVSSLGSTGGLRALAAGALDIAFSGRPLDVDQRAKGLTQAMSLQTAYGLVTSHPSPNGMRSTEIAAIFAAPTAKWADGTPIRIILRPRSDSDTPLLASMFPGMATALKQARRRPEVPVAVTDQDAADLAERVPGSLTGTTLTLVRMEKRDLRFVAIDGVVPTLENLEDGTYPYLRPIYVVLPSAAAAAAARFVRYLRSPEGGRALREAGVLPLPD